MKLDTWAIHYTEHDKEKVLRQEWQGELTYEDAKLILQRSLCEGGVIAVDHRNANGRPPEAFLNHYGIAIHNIVQIQ